MKVLLPVPESVHAILPTKETTSFKVTPVFFNIGINEKATLSETLGYTREQHRFVKQNDNQKPIHLIPPFLPSDQTGTISIESNSTTSDTRN